MPRAYTRIIPEDMIGKPVQGKLLSAHYEKSTRKAMLTVEVEMGPEVSLLLDSFLFRGGSSALDLEKLYKFREMLNVDSSTCSDPEFIENIEKYADLRNRTYEVEVSPRISKAGNPYFVLLEYTCGGRTSRYVENPRETLRKYMAALRHSEGERLSAIEENQRLRSTLVQLQMEYADLDRAYREELAECNRLRRKLGIPESVANIVPIASLGEPAKDYV